MNTGCEKGFKSKFASSGTMRDIHFVMSLALPYVNYMSHIVKTCVRRNFNSYHITMNKIVMTLSAMWLFDVIKNVMSSTVPEKNGPQSLAKPAKPRSL